MTTMKIGENVGQLTSDNLRQVMKDANMDWRVDQVPLFLGETAASWDESGVTTVEQGSDKRVKSHVANVRSDNKDVLAVVGAGYEVFQNQELAELVLAVEEESGAELVEAGTLLGGRDVFFLLRIGSFKLPGDDIVETYHYFGNNHAGLRSINAVPTSHRPFCSNILNAIVAKADKRGLSIWHTKNLRSRLGDALRAIRVSERATQDFQRTCERLADMTVNDAQVKSYFKAVYDATYGPEPEIDEFSPKGDKQRLTRRKDALEAWDKNLEKESERMNGLPLTAWNAMNAVTEWADHERRANKGQRAYANVLGGSAKFKETAFRMAGGGR